MQYTALGNRERTAKNASAGVDDGLEVDKLHQYIRKYDVRVDSR